MYALIVPKNQKVLWTYCIEPRWIKIRQTKHICVSTEDFHLFCDSVRIEPSITKEDRLQLKLSESCARQTYENCQFFIRCTQRVCSDYPKLTSTTYSRLESGYRGSLHVGRWAGHTRDTLERSLPRCSPTSYLVKKDTRSNVLKGTYYHCSFCPKPWPERKWAAEKFKDSQLSERYGRTLKIYCSTDKASTIIICEAQNFFVAFNWLPPSYQQFC